MEMYVRESGKILEAVVANIDEYRRRRVMDHGR
jgi:hypothetical protein